MICSSYDSKATLAGFALAVELLRESEMSSDELARLFDFEKTAMNGILRCPDGSTLGDFKDRDDPRGYWMTIHQDTQKLNPSNMRGRLRLPESRLVGILKKCKDSGSQTWHRDYLRDCEALAAEQIHPRIARWNARHPDHQVECPSKPNPEIRSTQDHGTNSTLDVEKLKHLIWENYVVKALVNKRAMRRGTATPRNVSELLIYRLTRDDRKRLADFPNIYRPSFNPKSSK